MNVYLEDDYHMLSNKREILLQLINQNPTINQRKLVHLSPFSLGTINQTLKQLHEQELVSLTKEKNRYCYHITDLGIRFLETNRANRIQEKVLLHTENNQSIHVAVILAAGKKEDFPYPACFCALEKETVLSRLIHQLNKNEIRQIYIVTGYKHEFFESISNEDITIVHNPDYLFTGSMHSLNCVANYIQEDFILIEDDIIIEDDGFRQILKEPQRDCTLISGITNSNDEAYVEVKNAVIYKVSKDISQVNQISGEMIGISKLSVAFYRKMVDFYMNNQNIKVNYEHIMLEIGKLHPLYYVKIDSCIWHEIDTKAHYSYVLEHLLPQILKKEQSLYVHNVKEKFSKLTGIAMEQIQAIAPIGGMTNFNYKIEMGQRNYVFRISGNHTDKMINRIHEISNESFAYQLNLSPKVLFSHIESGLKVTEFITNCETQTPASIKMFENILSCVKILQTLHNCTTQMENRFDFLEMIQQYEAIVGSQQDLLYDGYFKTKDTVIDLYRHFLHEKSTLVPCHNDPVPENFLKDMRGRMYLIDWEYAGMNDPLWDLGDFSLESSLSKEEEIHFLQLYFEQDIPEDVPLKILLYKICQDFLWSLWTCAKETSGQDYENYGSARFARCIQNLEEFRLIYGEIESI